MSNTKHHAYKKGWWVGPFFATDIWNIEAKVKAEYACLKFLPDQFVVAKFAPVRNSEWQRWRNPQLVSAEWTFQVTYNLSKKNSYSHKGPGCEFVKALLLYELSIVMNSTMFL